MITQTVRLKNQLFWPLRAFKRIVLKDDSYLRTSGWIESLKHGYPCRADGVEVPWMNYPTISFLENRLNKSISLFEFGSGFSTKFYARLTGNVISVENDKDWFERVKDKMPGNAELIFCEKDIDGEYCRTITRTENKYDVVIVDGRDRVNCVRQSFNHLNERGVILLDDSERDRYQVAIDEAKLRGYRVLDLEGLKPNKVGVSRSSLIYQDNNCLGI